MDSILQTGGGRLEDIESRHKLSLSGDNSANLESFTRELPRVFGSSVTLNLSTIKGASRLSLPSLPTFKTWEDSKFKKGLRELIKIKMVNIKAQVRSNIQNRLGNHETAMLVAMTCLDSTVSFITRLLTYVSGTHQTLIDSSFSEEGSWQLITQLVNHIFADDMNKVRYFVREAMDTHSKKEMGAAVMWGTFQTHKVMEGYMKYGIENCPSISSEYVKFLVTNTPLISGGEGLKERVDKLEEMIVEVERSAKGAKYAAGSAANGLDLIKKRVDKLEKK